MSPRRSTLGGVVLPVLLSTAVITGVTMALMPHRDDAGVRSARKVNDPTAAAVLLYRVGMSPEAFAAAGVTAEQLDALLIAAPSLAPANDRMILLGQATAALNQAKERAVRVPRPGDDELPTVAQAQSTLDGLLDDGFGALVNGLPADTVVKLATIRSNIGHGVPAYFCVVERTDAQWLALRHALAAKRISQRLGTELASAAATLISQAESDPAVASAKALVEFHGEDFRTAWNTRLAPPSP